MKLMVLNKNDKIKQDNTKLSLKGMFEKLEEEFKELGQAIYEKDKAHIAEEVLDVIQVCIAIMFNLFLHGVNMKQAIAIHNKKLISRGWEQRAIIKIKVANSDRR